MVVTVVNAQREAPVDATRLTRLARRITRQLRIRERGAIAVTFLGRRQMRSLNRRFLRHDRPTDVLSFRYDNVRGSGEPRTPPARPGPGRANPEQIVGEIFISPALARTYAREHDLAYDAELARYVVHGILHWLGHEDATAAQQRKMRSMEDALLQTSKIF